MSEWIHRVGTSIHRTFVQTARREDDQYAVIGAVIVSTFFVGFGGGIVFPILPNLGTVIGISPFMIGIILSATRFSRLFANAPAGILVDRIGTRTPFLAGMFVQSFASLGYLVAVVAPAPALWFLVARLMWGVGSALIFATAYTIAADVSDTHSRGASMGLIRGGVLFGAPTGLVLGGVVSEVASISAAFLLATLFSIIASLVAYVAIPETHVEGGIRESVKPWDIDTSVPAVTVGMVNFVVLFVYLGALFATLVLFLGANDISVFGFDEQGTSGLFIAVTVVTAGVSMFGGGYLSDRRQSRIPTLVVFLVVTFVGFILLAHASSLGTLIVACLCIGAGQGGTSGPMMALLSDFIPDERMARAFGTNNVLGDIGAGLGPVVTLPLVDTIGFQSVYLACAAFPLVAVAILLGGVYWTTGRFLPGSDPSDR